ncbi:MAG: amino acid adenylation domain-containing protein [Candidatus Aminicenantes bacterium]|nr:amino acid adenylation domain-containing protein [Candidatus Aminicenantes bacterium]NIM77280.1 amino acid adenylation domain-containing protein [Candidatus Aminicenantes bacterium]NIN16581.1 amino acid adenylation domain-containing protein [Candidatus Aminicenantes bacterium]NIN40439.1 amino acid adenylation domain-containing protein [Candidatus Aminicenantes bacterium]NIN83259.1 amino acid adenylation domain-containing protein [Candidatus Aminicenantes bacterium]
MEKRVISQDVFIASNQYVKEREYWLDKLSGAGELNKSFFPYDYNGEAKSKFFDLSSKDLVKTRFTGKLFTRLMEVSNGFDYTLHMIAVAVTVVLLYKYTYGSNKDIIVGAPIYKKEDNDACTEFVNTVLVLREQLKDNMTFKELLFQVRKTILEADKHKNYPIEVLVSQLNMSMSEHDFPLFDAAVLLENIHDLDYLHPVNLNMIFSFLRTGESVEMEVHYNPMRYKKTTVQRMVDHFTVLLQQLLVDVDLRLSDVEILTEKKRRQLLEEFNDTAVPYFEDRTIVQLFAEQAEGTPDGIAVVGKGEKIGETVQLIYRELNQKSNQLAHLLREKGVGPDTIVGIMVERSVEMMIGILGILKAGGAYLPIDPNYPEERRKYMLEDSNAALLLTARDLLDVCRGTACRASICNGTACCAPTNLAYVIYTSGTTGRPKGAMVEHRNVINLVSGLHRNIYSQYQGNLKVVLVSPCVFDASVQQIFAALLLGHTLYVVPEEIRIDGEALKEYYRKYCIDISDGTPTHLRLMVEDMDDSREGHGLQSGFAGLYLKHFIIGGEALPQSLVEDFLNRFEKPVPKITNVYGPTECCVDSTWYEISKETVNEIHTIPIGKPMPNEQIYIVNQQGQWQPIGVPGELCISGDGVGRGYLNQPELTAEKFVLAHSSWLIADRREKKASSSVELPMSYQLSAMSCLYKTGDLARWLADGNIEFLGRIDHQVKIRGFRIELEEIENQLKSYTYNYDDKRHELSGGETRYCSRCVLSSHYPGIYFDSQGVCNICREYEKYETYADNYFKTMGDFQQLVEKADASKRGEYDCLLLFSGGKDSSYVLYRLVEIGLKVLAFTFDNGYISDTAFENIKRITTRLGGNVDSIVCKAPRMKEIFVESLSHEHTVCTGCFKALTTISTRIAVEKGINMVITGLSRGQIFDTKLQGLYSQGILDAAEVEEKLVLFRKIYHSGGDKISRLLSTYTYRKDAVGEEPREEWGEIPIGTFGDEVFQDIHFVDFFRYDNASVYEIKSYLKSKDIYWQQPGDTGFCSSNCIINDVGIYAYLCAYGYHNYAAPLSWDCRLGKITRKEALAEIEFEPDVTKVNRILKEIGYFVRPIRDACVVDREDKNGNRYLCAYIVTGKPGTQEDVPGSRELREYLFRILPDYMIPSYFVPLKSLPLTPNGKVDRNGLPEPEVKSSMRYVAPETDVEKVIAEIWKEILGVGKIGIHDNFFDLGGNSLGVIKMSRRLKDVFKQNVPTAVIFLNSTIDHLARHFDSKVSGEESPQAPEEIDRTEVIDDGRIRLRNRLQRIQMGNE